MLNGMAIVMCSIFYVTVVLFAYCVGKATGKREGKKHVLDQLALARREENRKRINRN